LSCKKKKAMQTITITPKNKRQQNTLISLFKEMNIVFVNEKINEKNETLEEKIIRLYRKKHYSQEELEWFFSIPKQFRIDPFDIIEDGDIFYADQRNINELEKDLAQHKTDMKNGDYTTIKTQEELDTFFDNL